MGLDSFFLFLFLVGGDVENDGAVEPSAGAKLMKVGFCDVVSSNSVSIVSRSELFLEAVSDYPLCGYFQNIVHWCHH